MNSPTYQLSNWLASCHPSLATHHHVKNSHNFPTFISEQTLGYEIFLSFDVTLLFTNVPVDLACRVAKNQLTADTSLGDCTGLSLAQVVSLLHFCLNAIYLAYQGQFYQQSFGIAMGTPVSVTVADLIMEDVEQRALSTYLDPPPFWKSYLE